MTSFIENFGLILMLSIAVTALVRFPARRYLIVVISGTAIGAWLIGYASGARSAAETAYPFVRPEQLGQAEAAVKASSLSPLWGFAVGLLIVLLGYAAFGPDPRRKDGKPPRADGPGDHRRTGHGLAVERNQRKKSSSAYQAKTLQSPDGA